MDIVIAQIKKEVAKKHKIKVIDLEGKSRKEEIVEARNEAMSRCRNETDANLSTIGRFFNRSHATVIHALNKNGNGKNLHRDIGSNRDCR